MKPKFNHCIIITNSASTNHRRAERLAKDAKRYFINKRIDVIEIAPAESDSFDRLVDDILPTLNDRTLVCIGGGDGTISHFINKLLTSPKLPPKARKAVLLPLWGGNANDLAYMINGSAYTTNIKGILNKGRAKKIYPLEVNISNDTKETKLASNYVSFGASAYAAKHVNELEGRHNALTRFLLEIITVAKAALHTGPFKAETEGRKTVIYDLMLINGSRIAKVYRAPNRLTDRAFFELTVSRKHPYFAGLLRGFTKRRNRKNWHSLKVLEQIWAQLDGEVIKIPAGSTIDIKPSDQPFYVLSTKL
jgi:diacylglycerol kinase family enzyme